MAIPLRAKYTSSTSAAFNALTGVANTTEYITTLSAHGFVDNDIVKYTVSAGNTAISGLTTSYNYYVTSSNTTALKLAASPGGAAINLTAGVNQQGHSLTLQVFAGVQEMSNAEISDVISTVMLNEVVISAPAYTQLRITTDLGVATTLPATLINSVVNQYPSGPIGNHPATYSTDTYYLYEANSTSMVSASATVKPLKQTVVSGETRLTEMTDADIKNDIFPVVINDLGSQGQGSYYIALTGSPPAGGTWTARSTLSIKYANTTAVTSDSYTLYQEIGAYPVGYVRPLKQTVVSGVTRLTEMSDSDIKQWVTSGMFSEYIRTTGLGQYSLVTISPPSGTYTLSGTVNEKTNDITAVAYAGFYSSAYTQTYTNSFTQVWTRNLAYNMPYTQTYTNNFTQIWTGLYTSTYSNNYTQVYTSSIFTRQYTTLFTNVYTGAYTGILNYAGTYVTTYTGPTFFAGFARPNTGNYVLTFLGNYTSPLAYTQTIAEYFTGLGAFVGGYAGPTFAGFLSATYIGTYVGDRSTYQGFYSRDQYSNVYTQNYTQTYTGTYTQVWTQVYTRIATEPYTQVYTNVFSMAYTQLYTGQYTQVYTNVFTQTYTRAYTGIYTGLTVQSNIATDVYTLYLRVA